MSEEVDHPDLKSREHPIREDMTYQLKVWRFERIGWCVLVLLVMMGLAGVFSRGWLSAREVRSEDGNIRVEYEMFHRNGSTNALKITLNSNPEAVVELQLAGEMLDGFSIEALQPQPLRSGSSAQGLKLWLQTDRDGRATLYMTLRGDGLGLFRSQIATLGTPGVKIDQFIFP